MSSIIGRHGEVYSVENLCTVWSDEIWGPLEKKRQELVRVIDTLEKHVKEIEDQLCAREDELGVLMQMKN